MHCPDRVVLRRLGHVHLETWHLAALSTSPKVVFRKERKWVVTGIPKDPSHCGHWPARTAMRLLPDLSADWETLEGILVERCYS
jgi:hypothetical protein